jgi:enoyl-[acyl-carrier protein] reductase I
MTNLMTGKRGLIMGLANAKSLAWPIAQHLKEQGAELAFTYQGDALKKRVFPLAESLGMDQSCLFPCNVTEESDIQNLAEALGDKWGKFDFLVHSIGFSDKDELRGRYLSTSAENFANTMNISCYSLTHLCRVMEPLLSENASVLTLTYHGSQKVMPNYNVMGVAKAALETSVRYLAHDMGAKGIRVNSLSAGPVRTLASSAIGDFRSMLNHHAQTSPLRRNTTLDDVGKASLYLLSDLSSGVTGENHYVDAGYNIMGMSLPEETN